ncbi:hypothetical protein LCGC14_2873800 [marine sediment metagenome]|uniref:Uncharacterized protein n=1 Tax=marine sediment metagenome TaxID=412755 RepID=A0A0F8Y235_9ZZZZ
MKEDIKALLFAFVVAIIIESIAIFFNFSKGTPTIIALLTFMILYFLGKLERIENKLNELRRKRK